MTVIATETKTTPSAALSDDGLSLHNFEQIARLVNHYAGIQLPQTKHHMMEGRLRKRARVCGRKSVDDYCRYLFHGDGFEAEFAHLIDVMTTNKTDFFREPDHFETLRRIVPSLAHVRRGGLLKVWSAACSNGAEPYSLAMELSDLALEQHFRFAILATDICARVLEEARRAVYPQELCGPVSAEFRRRYMMRARGGAAELRIVPELRRLVRFERLNLMDESYPVDGDVDVIFLRNVLIYFSKKTQQDVVMRLLNHLKPGGFLFLGHSESMAAAGLPLQPIAPATFRKL